METRCCTIHCNRPLECFCWTCQSLICSFCMQDHNSCKHKAYSFRFTHLSRPKPIIASPAKSKQVSKGRPASTRSPSNPASKPESPTEVLKPVSKENSGPLCIKCGRSILPKDVQLKCQHWVHPDCLKEIVEETNKAKGLLFDVMCTRCSILIDYNIIELVDPQSAAELSLRTAIGDDNIPLF